MITHLTSVRASIIPSPCQPLSPPHNHRSSSIKRSWERSKRSPCSRPREEGQHGGKVVRPVVPSGNNECLGKGKGGLVLVRSVLTPLLGRAKQACPILISGSCGSSSTKPSVLYLEPRERGEIGVVDNFQIIHRQTTNKSSDKMYPPCYMI